MKLRSVLVAAGIAACVSAHAGDAAAKDPETVSWSQDWPRFRTWEGFLTLGMTLQAASVLLFYPDPGNNWDSGILFDDAARDALVLGPREDREQAALISDYLYYAMVAYPILVDTVIVTDQIHKARDVSGEMLAMNLEAYAVTAGIAITAEHLGRSRPMRRGCEKDPNYDASCDDEGELNKSFMSGHTAAAFAGAGLMCAHHQHLPLYGGGAPDLIACLGGIAVAGASGTLRISSDNHYATDVMLAAMLGFGVGYGLPSLLHYGFTSGESPRSGLLPVLRTTALGAPLTGVLAPQIAAKSLGLTFVGSY
jgi:membrane-associated phospholipid phosphatase